MSIISLPDGFNGDKVKCFTKILEIDKTSNMVKLQVAEPGKEYMIKWIRRCDYDYQIMINSRYGGFND